MTKQLLEAAFDYSGHNYSTKYVVSTIMDKSPWDSQNVFNSMRFTSYVAKSSAVFLQIHVPSPLLTQYNVERSKELCLDGFNTVCGVGGGG